MGRVVKANAFGPAKVNKKKSSNGKSADAVLKEYWDDCDRFADLFNAVLFEGDEIIRSDELETVDTEESQVFEHKDYSEPVKAFRDKIKVCKKSAISGVEFVLLGLENQTYVDYAMPIRVMGYDYYVYNKQLKDRQKKNRDGGVLESADFMSGILKTDKFTPVITVVVYYGGEPWGGPTTLHEILSIPSPLKMFVSDYKMLLVEARKNDLILHNGDNVHFFDLMEIASDSTCPTKEITNRILEYIDKNGVDESVAKAVTGASSIKIDYNIFKKGGGSMSNVFTRIREEAMEEGRVEGEARGEAKGIINSLSELDFTKSEILLKLQQMLNISMQEAEGYYNMYAK